VPLADWRDYLAFRAIRNFAPCGPRAFRPRTSPSTKGAARHPRMPVAWKQAVVQTDRALGQAVGEIYLARHFPPASRAMITDDDAQPEDGHGPADQGPQLDDAGDQGPRAGRSSQNLRVEVGGQTPPRDYSSLEVKPGEAFENLLRAQDFARRRTLARLGRPVDRGEWSMNPQTINAQSNSTLVKVMFPAGYLQPPNFDPAADPAVNYGAIGRVIGHEISHQFDDQGSKYDATGRAQQLVGAGGPDAVPGGDGGAGQQYDAYEPLPGLHINGR
jgi:putative endopeptidase